MDPARLIKASLTNTTTGRRIPVMYNPEELRLDQGNSFAEVPIPGLDASPVQYVRGKARTLSMDLFFDTYETGEDVRAHTDTVVGLLDVDPRTKAPPILVFAMGRLTFECVLVEATQRFTMFRRDGTPVRSTIAVRLQEFSRIDIEIERGFFVGPPTLRTAIHTVARGETASAVAQAVLGDPARWREIAAANGLDDPFDLQPGLTLTIPDGGKP